MKISEGDIEKKKFNSNFHFYFLFSYRRKNITDTDTGRQLNRNGTIIIPLLFFVSET